MKHFREYLSESTKKYDFRVKVAGEFTTEQENLLKVFLEKYKISEFKKTGKTPIQALPLDFPKMQCAEVNIYEITLDYPTTQFELTEYISSNLKITKESLVVRRFGEPSEQYQQATEPRTGALLTDPDYKESKNANFDDYYGDKYNMNFVKELTAELHSMREARGEKIPTADSGK